MCSRNNEVLANQRSSASVNNLLGFLCGNKHHVSKMFRSRAASPCVGRRKIWVCLFIRQLTQLVQQHCHPGKFINVCNLPTTNFRHKALIPTDFVIIPKSWMDACCLVTNAFGKRLVQRWSSEKKIMHVWILLDRFHLPPCSIQAYLGWPDNDWTDRYYSLVTLC